MKGSYLTGTASLLSGICANCYHGNQSVITGGILYRYAQVFTLCLAPDTRVYGAIRIRVLVLFIIITKTSFIIFSILAYNIPRSQTKFRHQLIKVFNKPVERIFTATCRFIRISITSHIISNGSAKQRKQETLNSKNFTNWPFKFAQNVQS